MNKDEIEFGKWIESIEFIDSKSRVIPTKLRKDESDDPEGDRESDAE